METAAATELKFRTFLEFRCRRRYKYINDVKNKEIQIDNKGDVLLLILNIEWQKASFQKIQSINIVKKCIL